MVISSLVIETIPQKVETVVEALGSIPGVEVHEHDEYKIVVTIEAETVEKSHDIANGFIGIDGVTTVNLIYLNFEDDPTIKTLDERRGGE